MTRNYRQLWGALLIFVVMSLVDVAGAQENPVDVEPSPASEPMDDVDSVAGDVAGEQEGQAQKGQAEVESLEGATKEQTPSGPTYHKVRPGESLWMISAMNLGDGGLWPALYRANRDQIQNPKILYPGQELAIPNVAPEEKAAIRAEAAQLNTQ
jgi:nucleoid-associated protein YgaU